MQARADNTGLPPQHAYADPDGSTCTFLTGRNRVYDARSEPDVPPQATESEARPASEASGRGGGANAAESAEPPEAPPRGATRKPERKRDRRDRPRDCGEPQRRLSVRFALSADVCGALGCRETDGLLAVEQAGEKRVLCPNHVRGWLR